LKIFIVILSLFFISGLNAQDKSTRLKQSGVDAFKRGGKSPLSPRLQKELNQKYLGFDKNGVLPEFDGGEFYFNYLSKTGGPTQKFYTEIIADKIFRIKPRYISPGVIPVVMVANPTLGGKTDPAFSGYMEVDGNWFYAERARQEFKTTFGPALFFDLDYGKLILNQNFGGNSQVVGGEGRPIDLGGGSQGITLETGPLYRPKVKLSLIPDTNGPYRIKKFLNITAGVGGAATVNIAALAQLGASVAIVPTIGGGIVSERIARSHSEASNMGHLSIPKKAEDFKSWKVGDKLTYDTHGGIAFGGGAGFYGLSVGVQFSAQGLWQKVYEKIGTTKVRARYNKNKLISFGMYAAAGPVNLTLDKFVQWENGLTFVFELKNKKGRLLLKEFMKGDLINVQKAAMDEGDLSVTSGIQIKGKTSGTKADFGIGIPFIPASARWSKQSILSETQSLYLSSKRRRDETKSGRIVAFKGKFFPIFKNSLDGFFTYVVHYPGVTDSFMGVVRSGQFAFNYQDSRTSRKELVNVLEGLKKRTGLYNFLNIKVPQSPASLGSVEVKFAVKFKSAATQFLLNQRNQDNLEKIVSKFIDSYFEYFKESKKKEKLCPFYRSKSGCKSNFLKSSLKAIKSMKSSLEVMAKNKSYVKKSREAFANAYSKFAEDMLTNPFVFQTVLNMTKGYGGDVYLSIESEKLKKLDVILRWKKLGIQQQKQIAKEGVRVNVKDKSRQENLEINKLLKEKFKRIEKITKTKPVKIPRGKEVIIDRKEKIIKTVDFQLPFLDNMNCFVRRRSNGSYFLFILTYKILNIKQIKRNNAIWFINRSANSVGKRGGKGCSPNSCKDYGIYHSGPQVRKDLFMSNMKVELGKKPKGYIEIYSSRNGYPVIKQDIRQCKDYPR